ncbi:MAG: fatty-acid oxidation protein subunit alpha [Opitutus sp.]|nr:fatty-acid oxidation protein subunit alpha [Opitutus sp.]
MNNPYASTLINLDSFKHIRRTTTGDGFCVLTFDRPDSSANVFDRATLAELDRHLDLIEQDAALKGLVLTSAKKNIFIAGADLHSLANASLSEISSLIEFGQKVFNRLAALPVPTVAAIHGAAMGGGCELALACDWRVASIERETKIGLPETQLGLLPAWGGSTRLPRLVGLPKALSLILSGKTLAGLPALRCGLVDAIAPKEQLLETALRQAARGKSHRRAPWYLNNWFVADLLDLKLYRDLKRRTHGHYPAVFKALEVVLESVSSTEAESFAAEREAFLELAQGEASHNLVRLFLQTEHAKKSPGADVLPVRRTAVIGAGVMGAGIAQWFAARGLPVVLRDIGPEQVGRGLATIAKLFGEGQKRRAFTATEVRAGLDRVQPATGEVSLANVDFVVEAAVEKMELKKHIFQRLADETGPNTILATNTSALSITDLAAATRAPERVVGFHFFNPVHRMQLVEVVVGRQTRPEVVQRAMQFARQIGKLPVRVADRPGFLVNRVLMPYLVEAGRLFEEGARVEDIDAAMLEFGMPMGPLRLVDEVGVDVAQHVARTLADAFGDRIPVPKVLGSMIEKGALGRKTGTGFYAYKGKHIAPNLTVHDFQTTFEAGWFTRQELQWRMALMMLNEAARCVEERVVDTPGEADFAMVMGAGFAPFRGGPLRYTDHVGAEFIVAEMDRLVGLGLKRFAPCELLRRMAASGEKFYRKEEEHDQHAKRTA